MLFKAISLFAYGSSDASGTAQAVQSDNSYGYEAPAAQQTYAQYTPEVIAAPKVCVVCDHQAPCWNGETCVARVAVAAPSYEAHYAQQGYATQEQDGYRRLQDGTVDQGSYTQENPIAYAQETHFEAPRFHGSCPCGTVDTVKEYTVHNNVVLWIAFGFLFVPGLYFSWRSFETLQTNGWNDLRVGASLVNMIASLAYLTMALGHGYVTKCNARDFYYARYVDWALTTPIMLYEFVRISARGDGLMQTFMVLIDVFMIVAGLIGELIEGSERWAFFGFSMLAFLPIMWFLCSLASDVNGGMGLCGSNASDTESQKLYKRVAAITLISWIGYPIIWILANVHSSGSSCGYATGFAQEYGSRALQAVGVKKVGVITVQGEAYAYTVLDIIAKSLVGLMVVCHDSSTEDVPDTPACHSSKGGLRGLC
jgi:bacteriorhodopsin